MRKFLVMVVAAGLSLNAVAADSQSAAGVKSSTEARAMGHSSSTFGAGGFSSTGTLSAGRAAHVGGTPHFALTSSAVSYSESVTQSQGYSNAGGGVSTLNGSKVSSSSAKTAAVSHSASKSKSTNTSNSHGHSNGASRALNVPHATKTRCVKKVSGDVISMEEATYLIETEAQMNRSLSQARIN